MGALFRTYLAITRFFGAHRRFIRRLAALCLVVLGVHRAADVMDDLVFRVIDQLDLAVDNLVWTLLQAVSPEQDASRYSQIFAEWVDLKEKDLAAKVLALGLELVLDFWLLDLVWGKRGSDDTGGGLVAELKASTQELREALWPLDLERLAGPPTLLLFAVSGALFACLAIESELASLVGDLAPDWPWAPNLAAAVAILAAAMLLWRFLPDLLHGSIVRAHQRAQRAREREATEGEPKNHFEQARRFVRQVTRGTLIAVVALPIAIVGLLEASDLVALIARTGTNL
jgi:hypothetical protein